MTKLKGVVVWTLLIAFSLTFWYGLYRLVVDYIL